MKPSATRPIDGAAGLALAGQWPFVGRAAELATLRCALASGPMKGAVVCGPAGVGKSRLVRQVAETVSPNTESPRLLVLDDANQLDDVAALVIEQWLSAGRIRLLATVRSAEHLPDALNALLGAG